MSGIEVVGILLGTFPLIIYGLEHWHDGAVVAKSFWRVRTEHTRCLRDTELQEVYYKLHLETLLLPIVKNTDYVKRLINDPDDKGWKDPKMQEGLETRLKEAYGSYMEIISQMNQTAQKMREELVVDEDVKQNKLQHPERLDSQRASTPVDPSKLSNAKLRWDYEAFRLKFGFKRPVRADLLQQMDQHNERLKRLLSVCDKVSAVQDAIVQQHPIEDLTLSLDPALSFGETGKETGSHRSLNSKHLNMEKVFDKVREKADLLFTALLKAWKCSCQESHAANLQLQHRTLSELCFDIILMFAIPSPDVNAQWTWKKLRCMQIASCSFPSQLISPFTIPQQAVCTPLCPTATVASLRQSKPKKVGFAPSNLDAKGNSSTSRIDPETKLCRLLTEDKCGSCVGIVSHENDIYHLHSPTQEISLDGNIPLTLDHILSSSSRKCLTRRQRYYIALLVASSVAQLQFTPWLSDKLTKEDIFFITSGDDENVPYHAPFIRQTFLSQPSVASMPTGGDSYFHWLGFLLLELLFDRRLEDLPLRQRYSTKPGGVKEAFDVVAASRWSEDVNDEARPVYASIVKWCFNDGDFLDRRWRSEMIKKVVAPLEMCQQQWKMVLGA